MIYIKNKGLTQTSISGINTQKTINELKWDAKYNGQKVDIKVDYNNNGVKRKYELELNNNDINKILNIANSKISNSNTKLYERIQNDFPSIIKKNKSNNFSSSKKTKKNRNKNRNKNKMKKYSYSRTRRLQQLLK